VYREATKSGKRFGTGNERQISKQQGVQRSGVKLLGAWLAGLWLRPPPRARDPISDPGGVRPGVVHPSRRAGTNGLCEAVFFTKWRCGADSGCGWGARRLGGERPATGPRRPPKRVRAVFVLQRRFAPGALKPQQTEALIAKVCRVFGERDPSFLGRSESGAVVVLERVAKPVHRPCPARANSSRR
jgi:hypothetical protein